MILLPALRCAMARAAAWLGGSRTSLGQSKVSIDTVARFEREIELKERIDRSIADAC